MTTVPSQRQKPPRSQTAGYSIGTGTMVLNEERLSLMLPKDDPWIKDEVKAQKLRYASIESVKHH